MWEIAKDIPDVNVLLATSRQQLGAKLLLAARARYGTKEFSPYNLNLEMWASNLPGQNTAYLRERRSEVERAFTEAWSWLQNKEWIVPYPSAGTTFVRISREAEHVTSEAEIIGDAAPHPALKATDIIEQVAKASANAEPRKTSRRVFIVHGHDQGAREAVARFLERAGLEPIILHEQADRGRTIIEKFEAHRDVSFAVVLLTPDDDGCEKGGTPRPRARQNVVLELGYFVGVLGRDHVCALRRGDVEIPSDLTGVVYVPFDNSDSWKMRLGRELDAAGFAIDWGKTMGAQ